MAGIPAGTVRTATARRLVELIATLDGFSTEPESGSFWVTRPTGKKLANRRIVVVGMGPGTSTPDGIAATHGPSFDTWRIPVFIGVTDVPDLDIEATEQTVEDAYNAIADLLALDDRLGGPDGPGPGCRGVAPTTFELGSSWEPGKPPSAWADIELTATADIERNR